MKVLLVEDDKILQQTLKKALETKQYEVICALTYNEAIQLFDETVEFLILDIELPDGNGIQLCKDIKRISSVW